MNNVNKTVRVRVSVANVNAGAAVKRGFSLISSEPTWLHCLGSVRSSLMRSVYWRAHFLTSDHLHRHSPAVVRLFCRTTSSHQRTCPTSCAASTWRRRSGPPPQAAMATLVPSQRTETASSGQRNNPLPPLARCLPGQGSGTVLSREGMFVMLETLLK